MVVRHEKQPSRDAADAEEKSLFVWLKNQKQAYAGTSPPLMAESRVRKLQALPGWKFPMHHVTWGGMFNALERWSLKETHLPAGDVHAQCKHTWLPLGQWLADQRRRLDDDGAKDKQMYKLKQFISRFGETA